MAVDCVAKTQMMGQTSIPTEINAYYLLFLLIIKYHNQIISTYHFQSVIISIGN